MNKANNAKIIATNGAVPAIPVSTPDEYPVPLEGVITVKLETGRVVQMVIGELSMLYEMGEIPNELIPIAARSLFEPSKENDPEYEKRYWERWKLVKWLAGRVLKTQIDPKRLFDEEVWQIYNLANNPGLAVRNFRRQQAGNVESVYELQDVGADTEPTAERAAAA